MKKVYKYQNGIVCISLPKSYNQRNLKKVTEEFLKKVISEEIKNGNSDTSTNFTKE